jgi:hypothetical protein
VRKRIALQAWIKTCGGLRQTRHRGTPWVGWMFALNAAACNLIRLPKLLASANHARGLPQDGQIEGKAGRSACQRAFNAIFHTATIR